MSTPQTTIRVVDPDFRGEFLEFLSSASYHSSCQADGRLVVTHESEIQRRVLASLLRTWSAMFPEARVEIEQPLRREGRWPIRRRTGAKPQAA